MDFLNRFRSPEERARRERDKAEQEASRREEDARRAEARASAELAEQQVAAAAAAAAERQVLFDALGPDLFEFEANSPEDAKLAIKLARIRRRELTAEKRHLSGELANHREQWRERQAGRYSTVLLGRGTAARMVRAGIQSQRRSERLAHADVLNSYSDAKQEIDRKIAIVDRLTIELERLARS